MRKPTLWPLVGVFGFVALGGLLACPPEVHVPTERILTQECPKKWGDWGEREITLQEVREGVQSFYLSGPERFQDIPEFHDCQKFLSGDKPGSPGSYLDGIFSIFAVGRADFIGSGPTDRSQFYEEAEQAGMARPAAQIYSSQSSYEPLAIQAGLNCLFLVKEGDHWWAAMRWDGREDAGCHDPIPVSDLQGLPRLGVVREVYPGQGPQSYPLVARWTWFEGQSDVEYRLGVSCDAGWCEVKSMNSPGEAATSKAGGVIIDEGDPESRRVHRVKAWYDEQILSEHGAEQLVASGILGTIFPHPRLGRYTLEDFTGVFKPTASIALTPMPWYSNSNPYSEKLNAALTNGTGGRLNQVSLCFGSWEECREREGDPEPLPCFSDDAGWWAKLESAQAGPGDRPEYRCVSRCPYSVQIPGTVRWAWDTLDEGVWMRCVNGCCEVGRGEE